MQVLKLWTSATASSGAVASYQMPRRTRIRCIQFDLAATGGAGVGRVTLELSKQNTSNLTNTNTVDTALASCTIAVGNALTGNTSISFPCDIPIGALEFLYLNLVAAGTAFAAAQHNVYIHID